MIAALRAWVAPCFLIAACSRSHPPPSTLTSAAPSVSAPCPLGVVGATLAVSDAEDGVDVTVTAPAPRVDEVRARVREAAALHGPAAHRGLGHDGGHMGAHTHGLRLTELGAVTATAVDVDGGARLHFTAAADTRDELRARIRERVDVREQLAHTGDLG